MSVDTLAAADQTTDTTGPGKLHLDDAGCRHGRLAMLTETAAVVEDNDAAQGAHIVAVDDDPSVRKMISDYLTDNDVRVTAAASGRELAEVMARETVDLVILDWRLPGEDGMAIARKLRQDSHIPIIMLTGRRDEPDRVMGLELGADDYLTKPFSPRELLARIRALLRRARAQQTVAQGLQKVRAYRFAGFEFNVRLRRLVAPNGETIALTNSEFNLLAAFLAAPQRVLSRDQLLGLSRLHNDEVYDRSIDVQVGRLRRKIQPAKTSSELIRTERGAGYVFTATVEVVR
jgi:two-component system OmpR family response regulator